MIRRMLARVCVILAVVLLALFLRVYAADHLPIDFDEDDYLRAGQQFATAIQTGDWTAFTRYNYRTEHPPLNKIVYGFAIAPLPPAPEIPDLPTTAPPASTLPYPHLLYARLSGALLGSLEALALALVSPLGALFLAINTWNIKYVSQVQLEAAASLISIICVLAYIRSKGRWNRWLALSAVALGLTAASKYLYCIVGIAILVDWYLFRREDIEGGGPRAWARTARPFIAWGAISLVAFLLADPYLWPDPVGRLWSSVAYHAGYAQSEGVQAANFPMWQPLVWLLGSVPWSRQAFLMAVDMPVAVLAVLGFPRLWRKHRVFGLWLALTLIFLLLWNVKWPQYILVISVPLCFAAAEGLLDKLWEPLVRSGRGLRLGVPRLHGGLTWRETKLALPWLVPGTIVLVLITLFPLFYQGAMSLTDFSTLSIRDGLTGGVLREAWKGVTGQAEPVEMLLNPNGRVEVNVVLKDRGEPSVVPIAASGLPTNQVHYAGPSFLLSMTSGMGSDILGFEITWTVLSVLLQAILGVGIALVLNRPGLRFRNGWRALFILPWAIPEFVGALLWLNMWNPDVGWLSLALHTPINWQANPQSALYVLLLASTWLGFPMMMIAATAGLGSISPEVYDATAVDGATRWEQFRYVTLPLLMPLLGPTLILRSIAAFNQFYLFYVIGAPYPLLSFATISFYLMNATSGFGGQFAVSAAINIFTAVVLLLLLLWFTRRTHVIEGVTYA